MIGYLNGDIYIIEPTLFIVEVGGIGYEVKVSLSTYSKLKDKKKAKIFTYLNIKEDAHTLYGFYDQNEKALFIQLISVSGVGPSIAIMMLSSMEVTEIQEAIASENVGIIKGVKGIGTKTAERVILELKDKVRKGFGSDKTFSIIPDHKTIREEAVIALITLGIQKNMAEKSVNIILKNADKEISLEDVIKQALKTA